MVERVRNDVLELIRSQELQPGDKLPTEAALAARFSVARSTIREALKHLEEAGIAHAVKGHGRFLSALGSVSIDRPITKYESITDMLRSLGHEVTTAVLDVQVRPANDREMTALGLQPESEVIHVRRIRYGDDQPLVLSDASIVRSALPGPVAHRDWSGSIASALEAHGSRIASSVARIKAAELPAEVEARYQLTGMGPWLLVEETCITPDGRRVLYAEDYHRGSEIAFNVIRNA
jgi:GntR family transcriptional regulator